MAAEITGLPLPQVLLIDDDAISRDVLGMMLEMHGFQVTTAVDGAHALALLEDSGSKPEVILMDTQMPGLSGVSLVRALHRVSDARIVAISGSDPGDAVRNATDGFLMKPIEIEALVALLGAKEAESSSQSEAGDGEQRSTGAPLGATLIDEAVLGKLKTMMSASAVREIYVAVAADLTTRVAALEEAMNSEDAAEVGRIAHAIKGGCGMVGLSGAQQAASRLETSNRHETWPEELSRLQDTLTDLRVILLDELL